MRSRVVELIKDLNTPRTFNKIAAEYSRACLNGLSWNPATVHQPVLLGSQHLIIGASLITDLAEILAVGQTPAISIGGVSVAQVIKKMELQNDYRVDTLILIIDKNGVSRSPVNPEAKCEPLLIISSMN